MARPRACHSPCQNLPPTSKDELARAAPTEGNGTPTPTLAVVPNPDNELFKQFMKAYLKAQTPALTVTEMDAKPCERPLKAWLPGLYYGDLHIECYRFCQKCKDHFNTAGAKGSNRIPFVASFLREKAFGRWLQYKRQNNGVEPMTCPKFKDFFRTNLGDSKAFVDGI